MPGVDRRQIAHAIRLLCIDPIKRAGEGHPRTPLATADTPSALIAHHLKFIPKDPLWFDRFVQPRGDGSMLIYSL